MTDETIPLQGRELENYLTLDEVGNTSSSEILSTTKGVFVKSDRTMGFGSWHPFSTARDYGRPSSTELDDGVSARGAQQNCARSSNSDFKDGLYVTHPSPKKSSPSDGTATMVRDDDRPLSQRSQEGRNRQLRQPTGGQRTTVHLEQSSSSSVYDFDKSRMSNLSLINDTSLNCSKMSYGLSSVHASKLSRALFAPSRLREGGRSRADAGALTRQPRIDASGAAVSAAVVRVGTADSRSRAATASRRHNDIL